MLKDYNTNKQKRKDTRSQSFAPRYAMFIGRLLKNI